MKSAIQINKVEGETFIRTRRWRCSWNSRTRGDDNEEWNLLVHLHMRELSSPAATHNVFFLLPALNVPFRWRVGKKSTHTVSTEISQWFLSWTTLESKDAGHGEGGEQRPRHSSMKRFCLLAEVCAETRHLRLLAARGGELYQAVQAECTATRRIMLILFSNKYNWETKQFKNKNKNVIMWKEGEEVKVSVRQLDAVKMWTLKNNLKE